MKQWYFKIVRNYVGGILVVFGALIAKCLNVSIAVAVGATGLCRLCSEKQAPA